MANLALYTAAKAALAAAKNVDEVKEVLNQAAAMAAYAKMAKDRTLEADAVELRMRCERRLGLMIVAQPNKAKGSRSRLAGKKAGTAKGRGKAEARISGGLKDNPPETKPITLTEAGVDKNLATRARGAAALSDADFESEIAEIRTNIETRSECSRPKKVTPHVVHSGLMAQAARAVEMAPLFEDWDAIVVDAALVAQVKQTSAVWTKLAAFLEAKLLAATPAPEKIAAAKLN